MDYLSNLNEMQKEAVLHKSGPLLILAGAGSGKTRVITSRVLHLIKEGVAPERILAITFTNKAAKEMKDRISALLLKDNNRDFTISFGERPFVSTFHSLGVYLLRENHSILGLPKHFTIFDRNDSLSALKEGMRNIGLDPKQHDAGKMLGAISRKKNEMQEFKEVGNYFEKLLSSVAREYGEILKREKALDFDDLLLKTLELFENDDVLDKYQERWQFIHIDEYQDTNLVQYLISKKLSLKHKNICVVGDADQNIYSWRGADIRNILNFEEDYPGAKVINLEENYRSTGNIIEAANNVIEKNNTRYKKNLFTSNPKGEKISIYEATSEKDEAEFIVTKSKELIKNGVRPSDIAVFYRANFQSRILEECFLKQDVPYQVLGTRFFERKEIKDVLAYISSAKNDENLTALRRIINVPPRGIGKTSLVKILSGDIKGLNSAPARSYQNFISMMSEIKNKITNSKPSDVVMFVAKISGIEKEMKDAGDDGAERLFNIKELANLARKYDSLDGNEGILKFLEESVLTTDQDELKENKDGVKLMTVH
ncbi:MAG: UvrD-helicase domain-containing protein, partial [Patescibacteria group bacterium]